MILTQSQLALENSLRRILPAGVVSCWIPDGYGGAKDVIGDNHGKCYGTHPNVPVLSSVINPYVGWVFGGDDYVRVADDDSFAMGDGDHVLGAWVYPTITPSTYTYLVAIGENTEGNQSGLGIGADRTLFLSAYSSPIRSTTYTLPSLNKWYRIIMSYNGATDVASFFVNGERKEDESITLNTTVGKCFIGSHLGGLSFFTGYQVLPFVANQTWSPAQAANDYLATKGMFAPRG